MKMATFTALNGGSPKATEGLNGTADSERPNGQSSAATAESRPTTGEVSSNLREREREHWGSSTSHERHAWPSVTTYPDVEGSSHKRKRSESDSPRREREPPTRASPPERTEPYDYVPPPHRTRTPSRDYDHERDRGRDRDRDRDQRDQYGTPPRDPHRGYNDEVRDSQRSYGDEPRDSQDHWHSQQAREERNSSYEGPYSAGPVSAQSDEQQMGESLRRATSQADNSDYGAPSPDGEYSGQYTPEQRRDGVISDPKKRKRNFSNRTKTGCLTCRKRKKKCDETKPECSNCLRGGFVCAGYPPQRGGWPKPEIKPSTVNIESKDPNYVPPGAYGMPQSGPYINGPLPRRDPLPYKIGQPSLRITPPNRAFQQQSDDDRQTASTLPSSLMSPTNKLSAMSSYNTSANVFPTPVSAATHSAFSERTPKDYQRVPPLHDLTRTEPDQREQSQQQQHQPHSQPHTQPHQHQQHQQQQQSQQPPPLHHHHHSSRATPTLPQPTPYSVLHGRQATSPPTAQSAMPAAPPSAPASGVQATAQLALSHTQFPTDRLRREKEEMLNGRAYYPFDKELVLERERCNAACWRFNNSTNPNIGVSPGERARLFRDILHPKEGVHLSPTIMSPVTHTGRVGDNVTVEAPFTCDYGYNIQIGNNVAIGRNCLINDVCEVRIGNNVIISPNVSIYTGTCSTDPRRRNGNSGPQYGKPIIIEDDVWIAANVVILAGVRIGKGSTVGAGSIVTRDVACFSIYMGQKAGHRRGISYVN